MADAGQSDRPFRHLLADQKKGHAGLMRAIMACAAICLAPSAYAQEAEADGVTAEIGYTAEVFSGAEEGSGPVVDNLDLVIDARTGSTRFHLYGLYNNGRDFSGPRFPRGYIASNIETGVKAVRLYEAWVDREFASGSVSLRAGLYDLNSEFDSLEASSIFINPAHGIGTDFSQSGSNGPSIFPLTSLGVRLSVKPSETLTLRAAILDGVPGDLARPKRTTVKLGKGDGALLVAEADKSIGNWRLIAGHWRYTGRFEDRLASALSASAIMKSGNSGYYLRGEGRIAGGDTSRTVDAFFRLGSASGRFNEVGKFASAGLAINHPFAGRKDDVAGVAMIWGKSSSRAKALQRILGEPIASEELSFEATYAFALFDWLTIQPDLQYFLNPAFETNRKALVAGVRTQIKIDF
jgi:porin